MATIIRRKKSKYWWVALFINGKRTQRSLKTINRKEAEIRAKLMEAEMLTGQAKIIEARDNLTVAELMHRYYRVESRYKKDGGVRDRIVVCHLERLIGSMRVVKLSELDLTRYLKGRSEEKRTSTTIHLELRTLRRALNVARKKWKMGFSNPFDGFDMPKVSNQPQRVLSRSELRRLMRFVPKPMRIIIVMGLLTGFRLSNIVRMRWSWVNLETGVITIPAADYKNGDPHVAAMGSKVRALLSRIHRRHPDPSPDSFVFLHDLGGPYSKNSAGRAFRRAVKLSGIAHVRFHDLRHTFLSGLAEKSASNIDLMQAAGHKDFRSTMRYIHGNLKKKREISDLATI